MQKFSVLILTIGIPASGKSSWAAAYRREHSMAFVVSTDELRKEFYGDEQCDGDYEKINFIHDEARRRAKAIIDNPSFYGGKYGFGPVVVVDSTNVDVSEWRKFKEIGASVMLAKTFFDVTPEEAMERQKNRERNVPLDILNMKQAQIEKNKKYLSSFFNMIL